MSTTSRKPVGQDAQRSIFGRILVGIGETPESLEAARQAAALATGWVTLLGAYDLTETVVGAGMAPAPPVHLDEKPIRDRTAAALERARREIVPIEPIVKVATGRAWAVLLDQVATDEITLAAVGCHDPGRAKGILIGSTATELIHKAPCSVLVARRPLKADFPRSIVVGVDGSKEAAVADAVARGLAARFTASLDRLRNVDDPVSTLVEAAKGADLLAVGSRGLHGVKALGSVSERVAHQARSSVLVIR
jgi:nucleotide-binding universal stress UspA family protein